MSNTENESAGVDRRTLIKRGAVVGGALVWATPVVQSLAAPAFAAGSAPCFFEVTNGQSGAACRRLGRLDPDQPGCCGCFTTGGACPGTCTFTYTPYTPSRPCV